MEGIRTAPKGGSEKGGAANYNTFEQLHLSPRQWRALSALLKRPHSREELDRIAGASNSPELIRQLRQRGINILCKRIKHIDRDGLIGWHGVYWIPASEKQRLKRAIAEPPLFQSVRKLGG
ncbi:hypothetical protein SAMN05660479_02567 [Microbulbifer thermotolerans]|nr:hypothetical protein SAMN05660479_02567 [Microbulbifer thermotolerans]